MIILLSLLLFIIDKFRFIIAGDGKPRLMDAVDDDDKPRLVGAVVDNKPRLIDARMMININFIDAVHVLIV